MSKLLIPVNFTTSCHNAYVYGLKLAEELKYDIVLVHYYSSSLDTNKPFIITGDGSINGSYLQRLKDFATYNTGDDNTNPLDLPESIQIEYETSAVYSISGAIKKRAKQNDIDFVVMATQSKTGLLDRWLGSTSTTISESCDRPVFLIPPQATFNSVERVVVANHYETAEPYPLWQIEVLAEFTGAEIHFVHVEHSYKRERMKFIPWVLREELKLDEENEQTANEQFKIVTVEATRVAKGLSEYADKIDAQLIVVVNQLRRRMNALFYAGNTQSLSLMAKQPILVLHTDVE